MAQQLAADLAWWRKCLERGRPEDHDTVLVEQSAHLREAPHEQALANLPVEERDAWNRILTHAAVLRKAAINDRDLLAVKTWTLVGQCQHCQCIAPGPALHVLGTVELLIPTLRKKGEARP